MKGHVLAAVIFLASYGTIATAATNTPNKSRSDDSGWVHVTSSDDVSFSAREGSFELTKAKNGTSVASILGQYAFIKTKIVAYNKLYVSTNDCAKGYGKLVLLDLDGNYSSESDFVSKGENLGSNVADFICAVYQSVLEKQNGKSL